MNYSTETWLPIARPAGYEVSDEGRVRSFKWGRPKILSPSTTPEGYRNVSLYDGAQGRRNARVHVLVLETFTGPRPEGQDARHLDGDPGNNALTNLKWGTKSENNLDQVRHGTHPWARRPECINGHEFTEANTYRRAGRRHCRECNRISSAKRWPRRTTTTEPRNLAATIPGPGYEPGPATKADQ